MVLPANVIDIPSLRERAPVFRDRAGAGARLASMLSPYQRTETLVLAIPVGGVPVAAELARVLGLPLDVASRSPFAVAAAYEIWRDVSDGEVVEALGTTAR
jgi:predicted phosphoribosyltransferase